VWAKGEKIARKGFERVNPFALWLGMESGYLT